MEKTELRVRLAMARAAVQTLERMIQAGECDAAEGADAPQLVATSAGRTDSRKMTLHVRDR